MTTNSTSRMPSATARVKQTKPTAFRMARMRDMRETWVRAVAYNCESIDVVHYDDRGRARTAPRRLRGVVAAPDSSLVRGGGTRNRVRVHGVAGRDYRTPRVRAATPVAAGAPRYDGLAVRRE